MSPWRWFAGHPGEYVYDYACDAPTREAVIADVIRDGILKPGDLFRIIEARSSTAKTHEDADCVPFLRTRNAETLIIGDDGNAYPKEPTQ